MQTSRDVAKEVSDIKHGIEANTYRKINNKFEVSKEGNQQPTKSIIRSEMIVKRVNNITITRMTTDDVYYVMSNWALAENWYPTQYTVEPFHAADPQGYYLLFLDDEPIASLSAVCYPKSKTAFLGLYIVIPAHRGKGFGKLLWEAVTDPLIAAGFTLGLNALVDKIPVYTKSGFKSLFLDTIWRYTGDVNNAEEIKGESDVKMEAIMPENFEDVAKYDQQVFGEQRKEYLRKWLFKPSTFAYIAKSANSIKGYGVLSLRVTPKENDNPGYRIGPLYADDMNAAERLTKALLKNAKTSPVVIDVPGDNKEKASALVSKLGFNRVVDLAHMRTKEQPIEQQQVDKVYGKSSLAIAPI